ncbi:helix-turn-helix domain-containing protein [Chryseobacterium indoltheticum]|uniref:helix-turn-helix domain-containing protein n=1 Tax=Chryseobacterium indoltheticum TaxID=254 RepID=UPI003F496A85
MNQTPASLARITKSHFNKTLSDLITERIIIEAKRELYLTDKTIKEIAYELGYEDEYYFSRLLKIKRIFRLRFTETQLVSIEAHLTKQKWTITINICLNA